MKYTPKIRIFGNDEEGVSPLFKAHMDQVCGAYGHVIVVNLIDKKKDQLMIGSAYQNACSE